jgi:hypothetical protein
MNHRRRHARSPLFVTLTAASVLVLTACNSDSNHGASNGSPAPTGRPNRHSSPAIATRSSSPAHAALPASTTRLVFDSACVQHGPEVVTLVDPTTGATTAVRRFTLPAGAVPTYGTCGRGTTEAPVFPITAAEDFNADYTRFAAATLSDGSAGSALGYVSAGGSFINLLPLAGAAPSHVSQPLFAPGTSTLWFTGEALSAGSAFALYRLNADNPRSGIHAAGQADLPYLISTTGTLLTAPAPAPGTWRNDNTLPAPDGSAYFQYTTHDDATGNPAGRLLTDGQTLTYQPSGGTPCQPDGFITAHQLLCDDLSTLTFTATGATRHSLTAALPGLAFDAVLSPDHKTITFETKENGVPSLYSIPAAGGMPTPIPADVTSLGDLMNWIS